MRLRILWILLFALIAFSCEPEINTPSPVAGDADFSVFVSLGNSLTAGFANNELYKSGQMVSYANIIAKQMLHTGGGEFKTPLMRDELGFGGRLRLTTGTNCLGNQGLGLSTFAETPDPMNFQPIYNEEGPFHNLGVPGARVEHLLMPGYGLLNAYFGRFASSPSASVIDDAMRLSPTFFSLWIGNNDVLGFALSGGTSGSITPTEDFRVHYLELLERLTSTATGGVIANIPDITSIPLFNTLPALGLVLVNPSEVAELNALWSDVPEANFQLGINGFLVSDASVPGGARNLRNGELVLATLPQDSLLCGGWGSYKPIPENYYLSLQQLNQINQALDEYNAIIVAFSRQFDLALVDARQLLREAKTGIHFDGLSFTTEYVVGGVFSLDAVHLSPRGNAIMANHFIDAINARYNSTVPRVSVTQYPGIIFP